jgi:hypothetical protein
MTQPESEMSKPLNDTTLEGSQRLFIGIYLHPIASRGQVLGDVSSARQAPVLAEWHRDFYARLGGTRR